MTVRQLIVCVSGMIICTIRVVCIRTARSGAWGEHSVHLQQGALPHPTRTSMHWYSYKGLCLYDPVHPARRTCPASGAPPRVCHRPKRRRQRQRLDDPRRLCPLYTVASARKYVEYVHASTACTGPIASAPIAPTSHFHQSTSLESFSHTRHVHAHAHRPPRCPRCPRCP